MHPCLLGLTPLIDAKSTHWLFSLVGQSDAYTVDTCPTFFASKENTGPQESASHQESFRFPITAVVLHDVVNRTISTA